MPQLDLTTWFGQYFSFVVAFGVLYFWVVTTYLPAIKRSLGLRQVFLSSLESGKESSTATVEQKKVSAQTESIIQGALASAKGQLALALSDAHAWNKRAHEQTQVALEDAHAIYADACAVTQQTPAVFESILTSQEHA